MPQRSPTIEGFRTIFRRPSFGLAEIAWRWSFGIAGSLLVIFAFLEYLHTLPVTSEDLFLLRTRQPALISQAIQHILHGSMPRLMNAAIVLGLAMALAWIAVATLGRAVTVQSISDYLQQEYASAVNHRRGKLRSLAGLNFLRAAAALAAIVGGFAAWFLAAASSAANPAPGSALLIFLTIMMMVGLAWSAVNWLLSLAPVFVISEGEDCFGAIAAAVDICRMRLSSVLAASTWFGLVHLAAWVIASSVVAFPLAFAGVLPAGVVLGGVLFVSLLYFALADFIYVGRLAAYIAIIVGPPMPPVSQIAAPPPQNNDTQPSAPSIQPSSAVDPTELILSDIH